MTYRILPNALHFSEFQGGYHGTCGETALATAMVCSTPPIEDTQEAIDLMLSMTHELISLGWASSSGATTTQHLRDEAGRRGFNSDSSTFISFQQPLANSTAFHNLLLSTAGTKPIVIEIARAGNLPGDEVGVQYHFICIVGITDAGYICNDGDNANISSHLVTYSWAEIEAAVPCGVLVLEMKTSGGSVMPVPAGWSDANSVLTDPDGNKIYQGFRDMVLNWPGGWESDNHAITASDDSGAGSSVEYANATIGKGTRRLFRYRALGWSPTFNKGQPYVIWMGDELLARENEVKQLEAQAQSKDAEISSLESQISGLQAQIAALKSQPAAPAQVDPSVKNALAAALQLVQPYSTAADDLQAALKTLP